MFEGREKTNIALILEWRIEEVHVTGGKNNFDPVSFALMIFILCSTSRRGDMEKNSAAENFPVAKMATSFLKDNLPSSSFDFPDWNKGRIVNQNTQLKRLLSEFLPAAKSETEEVIKLTNTTLPLSLSRTSMRTSRREKHNSTDTDTRNRRQKELMPSTV